ncbi:hypothetical protein ACNKFW_12200 (plasmid) [Paracoccus sp. TD-10]|uniref:aldose epimerase family protein n=1 Tax=Paracoccus sp. TD-10 TaxID=3395918 RepID=UPI003AAC574F
MQDLALVLRPSWGGRVLSLTWRGQPILSPMQGADGAFDGRNWPRGGAYPLFPFHNRIPLGRFSYRGRDVRLPVRPQEPNAVHGHAHQLPWHMVDAGDAAAELVCEDAGDGAWPWAFAASQRFQLRPNGLELLLSIRNRADETMPAGLGWHPFFAKCRKIASDAAREWAMGADFLPSGDWHPAAATGADTRYLSDWSCVDLALSSGLCVTMRATGLRHLVIHDPEHAYSCVEPVSHLANSMNLYPARAADNLADLAPGDLVQARISLAFRPLQVSCR